jgi:hypothetical protein
VEQTAVLKQVENRNKASPDGYKLFAISFKNGQPVHPSTSTTAAIPIVENTNLARCPSGCFRPTAVTFDLKGRLYMASDKTGEVFVIGRTDGQSVDAVTLETTYNGGGGSRSRTGEGMQNPLLRSRQSAWGMLWRMFGSPVDTEQI